MQLGAAKVQTIVEVREIVFRREDSGIALVTVDCFPAQEDMYFFLDI